MRKSWPKHSLTVKEHKFRTCICDYIIVRMPELKIINTIARNYDTPITNTYALFSKWLPFSKRCYEGVWHVWPTFTWRAWNINKNMLAKWIRNVSINERPKIPSLWLMKRCTCDAVPIGLYELPNNVHYLNTPFIIYASLGLNVNTWFHGCNRLGKSKRERCNLWSSSGS